MPRDKEKLMFLLKNLLMITSPLNNISNKKVYFRNGLAWKLISLKKLNRKSRKDTEKLNNTCRRISLFIPVRFEVKNPKT